MPFLIFQTLLNNTYQTIIHFDFINFTIKEEYKGYKPKIYKFD